MPTATGMIQSIEKGKEGETNGRKWQKITVRLSDGQNYGAFLPKFQKLIGSEGKYAEIDWTEYKGKRDVQEVRFIPTPALYQKSRNHRTFGTIALSVSKVPIGQLQRGST